MNPEASSCALFRRYPALAGAIPRLSLGTLPSPVEPLTGISSADLWIKRDDLASPAYGGNKVRKLEFILADVLKKGKTHVVTMGGAGTNHGLATAIFGRRLSRVTTLLLYPQPLTEHVRLNLRLFARYQARLRLFPSLWRTVFAFFVTQRLRTPGAYFLFAGGSTPVGTLGFVNAAFELREQIRSGQIAEPAAVFCPLGSNGTLAGLALGARMAGLKSRVIGVRVTAPRLGPFPASTPSAVRTLMVRTLSLMRKRDATIDAVSLDPPVILGNHLGPGYGMETAAGKKAARLFHQHTGLALDPTYTAKTFAAVLDRCAEETSAAGPILYWHTLNSRDLTAEADAADTSRLPAPLRSWAENEGVFHDPDRPGDRAGKTLSTPLAMDRLLPLKPFLREDTS